MTNTFSARFIGMSIAAMAALAIGAPAGAQTSEAPITVSVPYGDLNINHAAGAKVLLERIRTASVQACGGAPDIRLLAQSAAFDQCRKAAVNQAVAQMGSVILTALIDQAMEPVSVASR